MPWQLEGYTLKLSKKNAVSGYSGVSRSRDGKRWQAELWSPEYACLGSFDRPEQAALAIAKHRGQLAGQSMEEEESEGVEEEEEEEEADEEEEDAEEEEEDEENLPAARNWCLDYLLTHSLVSSRHPC